MDIQQLALVLTEQDLSQLASKHLPADFPIEQIEVKLSAAGMHVHGEVPLFVPVRFSTLWELEVRQGKIIARLVSLHAFGLPVTIFRSMILKHLGDAIRKVDGLTFEEDQFIADVDKLAAREGLSLRSNLQTLRCEEGCLWVSAGKPSGQ